MGKLGQKSQAEETAVGAGGLRWNGVDENKLSKPKSRPKVSSIGGGGGSSGDAEAEASASAGTIRFQTSR